MNEERLYKQLDMNGVRLLQRWRSTSDGPHFQPPTDVYETEDSIVVIVEVAGLLEDTYQVSISDTNRLLTIAGERSHPVRETDSKITYHQLEIHHGKFISQVALLGARVDSEVATATYESGYLTVTLPKAMPRQVPVQSTGSNDAP